MTSTKPDTLETAHSAQMTALGAAQALATNHSRVELQGIACHPSPWKQVMTYALCGGMAILLTFTWKTGGVMLALAILLSAVIEVEGGQGWLKKILIRKAGSNIIIWKSPRFSTPIDWEPPEKPVLIVNLPRTQPPSASSFLWTHRLIVSCAALSLLSTILIMANVLLPG